MYAEVLLQTCSQENDANNRPVEIIITAAHALALTKQ